MKKILLSMASMLLLAVPMQALTVTATVPAQAKECFIAGNFNGWSTTATPMTSVNETTFTVDLDVSSITNDTLDFKICAGNAWAYEQLDPATNFIYKISTNPTVNVTVVSFKAYPTPTEDLIIEVLVPTDVIECYIVGGFNNWSGPSEATKMSLIETTVDGDVFRITINAEANTLEYKFCAGPSWDYEQTDATNFKYSTAGGSVAVNSFKKIYDPSKTGTIVITATVPEGTAAAWLIGSNGGWSMDKGVVGVKNVDNTFTFTVDNTEGFQYRLYNQLDWSHPEVDELGADRPNRIVVYPTDANTTISVYAWKETVTAIDGVSAFDFNVYTSGQTIQVEGVDNQVKLYDLTGSLIQAVKTTGTFISEKLKTGIYIIIVDGMAQKVLVK